MKFDFFNTCFIEREIDAGKIAVSGSDADLSWEVLAEKAERLAGIFRELAMPPGHPVMIYGHKESFFPVAILAAQMCDLPYIPVDRIYPVERLLRIMEQSGSQILVLCGEYPVSGIAALEIRPDFGIVQNSSPDFSRGIPYRPDDPLRYVLFTSGSTGEPKGVQITRESLLSFCDWLKTDYDFCPEDVFLNQSLFTFDVSLYDLAGALQSGGTMLLIDTGISKDPDRLFDKLRDYGCTIWISTPSYVYMYLRESRMQETSLPALRKFLFAGEDLGIPVVRALMTQFPKAGIFNAYGPTEATVTTTLAEITPEMVQQGKIPIGYPRNGGRISIRNAENNPALEGELVISGPHVSIGYLNDPLLTARKFEMDGHQRAFLTGDLGYYENGLIYFTGRNDDMIKLHGYRIELGEISSVIRSLEFVDDAITVPLKRGDEIKRIISFYILRNPDDPEKSRYPAMIRTLLMEKLPAYMVPGDLMEVREFPLNTNQKTDRAALIRHYIAIRSGKSSRND